MRRIQLLLSLLVFLGSSEGGRAQMLELRRISQPSQGFYLFSVQASASGSLAITLSVAGTRGLLASNSAGDVWEIILPPREGESYLYTGGGSALYAYSREIPYIGFLDVSHDFGLTWQLAIPEPIMSSSYDNFPRFEAGPRHDARFGFGYLYETTDDGRTWLPPFAIVTDWSTSESWLWSRSPNFVSRRDRRTDSLKYWAIENSALVAAGANAFVSGMDGHIYAFQQDSLVRRDTVSDQLLLVIGDGGARLFARNSRGDYLRSLDSARNWSLHGLTGMVANRGERLLYSAPYLYLFGSFAFRSSDFGDTWQQLPLEVISADYVSVLPNRAIINRDYITTDEGVTWSQRGNLRGTPLQRFGDGGALIQRTERWSYGNYEISRDGGSTWSFVNFNPWTTSAWLFGGTDATGIYFSSEETLYRTTDLGLTWRTTALPDKVAASAVAPDGRLAYSFQNAIYLSSDEGASWVKEEPSAMIGTATSFCFDRSGNLFAAVATEGIYCRSSNGNWRSINLGLPINKAINDLALDSNGTVYAATDDGVYYFDGKRWIDAAPTLKARRVLSLAATSEHLYLGTGLMGVLEGTPVLRRVKNRVSSSRLRVYPNPVVNEATIEGAESAISIHDCLGREVATLLPDATGRAHWDATSTPDGAYIFRSSGAGEKVLIRR